MNGKSYRLPHAAAGPNGDNDTTGGQATEHSKPAIPPTGTAEGRQTRKPSRRYAGTCRR
jgi:hypothetical protein